MTEAQSLLSKPWQKFLLKFKEIEQLEISSWKEPHLLGYFCQKYHQTFHDTFALSFKGPPSKCTEIYLIKKTMAMLDTLDPHMVKDYIDWIFESKIIPGRLHIRTVGYLTTPGFGNEFKSSRSKKNKITKSSKLPLAWKSAIDSSEVSAETYGDLAFIKMALEASPNSESRKPYKQLFSNLIKLGLEPSLLDSLV